jgi:ubiquinone/menaquinone biosynthesis C-methylase UbiE
MADTLTKLAYQTFQQGKSVFGLTHKTLSSQFLNLVAPKTESKASPLSPELLLQIQQRLNQLLETDWQDADRGIYPASLLFDNPWEDFFRFYPALVLDLPQIWERANQKRYQDFSPELKQDGYPSYYLRNFHHQTDGYLSDMSANLYDLQVEILFNGTADAMRRRILAPLKHGLEQMGAANTRQTRVLDVACGTGRTLKMIRGALSEVSLFGVDLSDAYLRKANQLLSQNPGELPQLVQANAEELPYLDGYFQGVTCVFLFHELPAPVRQHVIDQCYRVIQPGGMFVICDSIQVSDSPSLMPEMENFPEMFHEPFYRNYTLDNMEERLETAGFTNVKTEVHFMSKYWSARKPA